MIQKTPNPAFRSWVLMGLLSLGLMSCHVQTKYYLINNTASPITVVMTYSSDYARSAKDKIGEISAGEKSDGLSVVLGKSAVVEVEIPSGMKVLLGYGMNARPLFSRLDLIVGGEVRHSVTKENYKSYFKVKDPLISDVVETWEVK